MPSKTYAASGVPDLPALLEDWNWCVEQRDSRVYAQLKLNVNRRSCYWPGQTDDGKRWGRKANEKDVFPWPGAADTRMHLVDLYVKSDAAMLMTVWRRNKIAVQGTEVGDAGRAKRMTQLMRWMRYTQMKEYPTEARLHANYLLERGASIQGLWWVKQKQMGYETVTVMQLTQLAQAGALAVQQGVPPLVPGLQNSQLAELPALLADPSRDEEAYVIADVLYPDTKKAAIKRAIVDLRDSGEARIPRPYTLIDRPKVCTLALNEDVFLPPESFDIDEDTASVHWRELVTEATLRSREDSMDWDGKWVAEMIKTRKGAMTSTLGGTTPRRSITNLSTEGRALVSSERLFEVIHTYRRELNDDEVPVINYTVWNPGMVKARDNRRDKASCAAHSILTYDHGKYPLVLTRREMRSRNIDDSRGVGQIAGTWEDGLKAEIDSSRDRNSLNTVPPSYHPPGKAPEEWGPGAQVSTNSPERYGFFRGPGWDVGSKESRTVLADLADRYFGRPLPDGRNQLESSYMSQDLADTWMEGSTKIGTMELQLLQQYLPEQFAFRIVGADQGKVVQATRAEIQGQFDLAITFNVSDLDNEVVKEKIALIKETLAMDRNSVVDINEMIKVVYELVDPQMGERVIRPEAEALEAEIADEADTFAKTFAGLAVDVKEGQAFQPRLEWLQQMLQQNATAQARMQNDPNFKSLVERRIQQLSHQVEQFGANAQAGRTGAK